MTNRINRTSRTAAPGNDPATAPRSDHAAQRTPGDDALRATLG
jgi:hypothetical protein